MLLGRAGISPIFNAGRPRYYKTTPKKKKKFSNRKNQVVPDRYPVKKTKTSTISSLFFFGFQQAAVIAPIRAAADKS